MVLHSIENEDWLSTLTEVKGICGRVIRRSPAKDAEDSGEAHDGEERPS